MVDKLFSFSTHGDVKADKAPENFGDQTNQPLYKRLKLLSLDKHLNIDCIITIAFYQTPV